MAAITEVSKVYKLLCTLEAYSTYSSALAVYQDDIATCLIYHEGLHCLCNNCSTMPYMKLSLRRYSFLNKFWR